MELGVLGTLTLSVDGRHVHVGSRLRQLLLGTLVCHANSPVPVGRLAETLWADPPASAAQNLRQYVHHLRKTLPDRIIGDRHGYRLILRDGELDSDRFEALTARAGAALARGAAEDAEEADGLLREALSLWRGSAYADLTDVPVLRRAALRLEELRLSAIEQRVEARLRLGRHEELIPELASLVADHPLRERLRGQWMFALHRAGRRSEALDVYQRGRRLLAEQLGLEPGPVLRRVEREISAGDPGRYDSAAGLPADAPALAGRAAEGALLRKHLLAGAGTVPIAAITGTGRTGKSALAIRVARQVASGFPDGTLYADLRSLDSAAALARMLSALGCRDIPAGVDEAACRFRSLTHGRRYLVVLDNAVDVTQVRPLLPASPGCGVLVTCRGPLAGLDGAAHVRLEAPAVRSQVNPSPSTGSTLAARVAAVRVVGR